MGFRRELLVREEPVASAPNVLVADVPGLDMDRFPGTAKGARGNVGGHGGGLHILHETRAGGEVLQ